MKLRHLYYSLLLLGVAVLPATPSVIGVGNGEINYSSEYSVSMSWDTIINQTTAIIYDDLGNMYYLSETDPEIGVNYTIDPDGQWTEITLIKNPTVNKTDFMAVFCYEQEINSLRRFEIPNNGTYCLEHFYVYQFLNFEVDRTYRINNQKIGGDLNIPFVWYIGNGAGGGGGCSCLPSTTNVVVSIASIASSYPINIQDSTGRKVQYSGTPSGCSGATLETKYRPSSTWEDLPIGTWHNWGTDTADSSGQNIKVVNPVNNVGYWKPIDMQQVDNDVDFLINFSCAGSVYDGYTSPIAHSSIYHGFHRITTNFTNHSNYTTGEIPFSFYTDDESPHLLNVSLYINGTINQTYTGIYYGSSSLNVTFNVTFPVGNYEMYGISHDLAGFNNTTGVYYFTVAEEGEEGILISVFIIMLTGIMYFGGVKLWNHSKNRQ